MAKIIYEIYQNQVEDHPSKGKYFARVKTIETLNTRKLANHIAEHGSIYTPDVIFGVLEKFRSCLIEQLLNSRKVKIDGLGIFYLTAECAKSGTETPGGGETPGGNTGGGDDDPDDGVIS